MSWYEVNMRKMFTNNHLLNFLSPNVSTKIMAETWKMGRLNLSPYNPQGLPCCLFLALCGDILLFLVFFFALVLFLTPSLPLWEFEEMRRRVCLYWTSSVLSSPEKFIALNSQKDPDVGWSTGYNFPFSSTRIKKNFLKMYL